MPVNPDILGMVHKYPQVFTVGREQVRQYAKAVKSDHPASMDEAAAAELGHDTLIAGPTFVSIVALLVQQDFFRVVDVGMETADDAEVLQTPDPSMTGRRCDPDEIGQGGVRHPRVTMKRGQQAPVGVVEVGGPNILRRHGTRRDHLRRSF